MLHRFVFILLLCLNLAVVSNCNAGTWADAVEKYGPVPKEILEPVKDVEAESQQNKSVIKQFLQSIGLMRRTRPTHFASNCLASQRVVMSAIEMYNMDNAVFYKQLNPSDLVDPENPLLKGGYLRYGFAKVEPGCVLRSYGDLSDMGIVYCEYHGTTTEIRDELRTVSGYKPAGKLREYNGLLVVVMVTLGSGLLLLGYKFLGSSRKVG